MREYCVYWGIVHIGQKHQGSDDEWLFPRRSIPLLFKSSSKAIAVIRRLAHPETYRILRLGICGESPAEIIRFQDGIDDGPLLQSTDRYRA